MGAVRIGTSGWDYDHWVGPVYAEGTPPARRLAAYGAVFDAVEVNGTFYSLPSAATVARWREAVPEGFIFACKASRYITHQKKLKDPDQSLARFLDAVAPLGDRLGPLLFQLPPRWRANPDRLDALLSAVPAGFACAVEPRDPSWFNDDIDAVLARHDAAFVVHDLDGRTSPIKAPASWAYVRLHGPDMAYQGQYDDAALSAWARVVADWRAQGRRVFVFFDNDQAGYAARDARRLRALIDAPAPFGKEV